MGPRIVRAGPILNGQSFNSLQMVIADPGEARGAVRALKMAGVDFLKTHRRTPRDAYFAIIDEAKKQGLVVVGHIPMTVTPEEARDAGQASLEHTDTLFEGTFSAQVKEGELPNAIARFRAQGADSLFAPGTGRPSRRRWSPTVRSSSPSIRRRRPIPAAGTWPPR